MPINIQPEHAAHEEIAELERKLQEKKAALVHNEGQTPQKPEKEVFHEVVGEHISEHVAERSAPQGNRAVVSNTSVTKPSTKAHDNAPLYEEPEMKERVQELITHAFSDGNISSAVKRAVSTGDAALIDAFHDVLVDELYTYMVAQGKIKSVE